MGVGGFSVLHSQNAEIAQVDASLEFVAKSAYDSPLEPVSAALYALEQSSLDMTMTFLTHDGQETIIKESSLKYFGPPNLSIVEIATRKPIRIPATSAYRVRSVLVQGGDYILLAESTQAVDRNFQSNVKSLALFTFGLDSCAALALFFFFRRSNRRTETASLARMQEFLGDASHELRTPLTVIKGYVEILIKNQLLEDADRARAFNRVGNEITRMESLIQDLLLLAELGESGARDIEVVDLSEIVKAHAADFMTLNPARSVQLAVEPEVHIDASRDYMARLIQNALTNIMRHTAHDDAVMISLSRRGRNVELTIEDGGPGLPESAYKEDIRSLNRFDKSRSREHGGSGLGMSIMSGVIQKLGGRCSLRKSALGGLAIVVDLPASKD
jgi:signal transduction histidine kinase